MTCIRKSALGIRCTCSELYSCLSVVSKADMLLSSVSMKSGTTTSKNSGKHESASSYSSRLDNGGVYT